MHPVLFRVGPVTLHTYGLLVATGVLLGLWLARRRAKPARIDPERVWNLGIYMVLGALVGAKLWFVAEYWSYYAEHPREIFALSTLQSAGVFYGGLISAVIVLIFYVRAFGLKFLPLADVYAPALALGHAIGRLGCFSAGCCWGRETTVPWGVTFTDPYAGRVIGTPLELKLHPTQLYEFFALLAIGVVLLRMARQQRFTGQIFAAYIMLYGAARGVIEAFRGDPGRTMLFGGAMSLMQVVSVGLILLGGWLWWQGSRQPALAPAVRKP